MQPGVFSLSSWDLVGALPVSKESVQQWASAGDHRWINRGAVDLLGTNPNADTSLIGLPRALYGNLIEQLKDPESFASCLKRLLAARKKHRLAEAELLDVPDVSNESACVLIMRLPEQMGHAITALNFGRQETKVEVDLKGIAIRTGRRATDIITERMEGVSNDGRLTIHLDALAAKTLVLTNPKH